MKLCTHTHAHARDTQARHLCKGAMSIRRTSSLDHIAAVAPRIRPQQSREQPQQQQVPVSRACGICEVSLDSDEPVAGLVCTDPPTHLFHLECIKQWRSDPRVASSRLCPECSRDPVLEKDKRAFAIGIKGAVIKVTEGLSLSLSQPFVVALTATRTNNRTGTRGGASCSDSGASTNNSSGRCLPPRWPFSS